MHEQENIGTRCYVNNVAVIRIRSKDSWYDNMRDRHMWIS